MPSSAVSVSPLACGEMMSTSPFWSAVTCACESPMKRMMSSMFAGLWSPLYFSFAHEGHGLVGSHESMMNGPLERYSDGSSGSDVKSKPVFQKSAAALRVALGSAGAAASPAGCSEMASTRSSTVDAGLLGDDVGRRWSSSRAGSSRRTGCRRRA